MPVARNNAATGILELDGCAAPGRPAAARPTSGLVPTARAAAALRARHGRALRLPDALVVATALELEAERVLTTDAGWPAVDVRVEVVGA